MPTHTGESARLAALRRYRILDTEPERAFDDLALLASQICGTPIALIALVDENRQWFKARIGTTITETSRAISFCAHAIRHPELFVIPDAREDARFSDNPQVTGDPHIRFYAGAPLVTPEGHALGTLCVIDRAPRVLSAEQMQALQALKRQAEGQLELRRNLIDLQQALEARDQAEAEQLELIGQLQASNENVRRLSGLLPLCSTCQFSMTIPANPAAIPALTDGVSHVLQEKGWAEKDVMAVELALQEAVANAIRHGCRGDSTNQLQCSIAFDESGDLVITVRDRGAGFDPGKVPNPLDLENFLKSSGRGIFLINSLMDDVQYADRGRELTMRKRKVSGTAAAQTD